MPIAYARRPLAAAVRLVVDRALTSSSPVLIEDHRGLHELLLSGVPVSYVDHDGMERHDRAWVVDFEHPERNEFLAINQLTIIAGALHREIPDLDRYVEIVDVSDLLTARVGAKYHQVHPVGAAVESVATAITGDKCGGLVWHTQGAGKSYTMVFFVNKLRRDPRFLNPTVVAVTDRTDLDNQLAETFSGAHLGSSVQQADEITGGPQSLHALLNVPAGGIVFTTIQKFAAGTDDDEMPVLSERRNIVVIADEAHRSQYATFAENITLALPNATRIGFTGTPVESADRSTRLVFGDYISIYRMRQAQEDRATVPIYYESRQIPLDIADPDQLAEVEEVLEAEEQEAASKLVTAWAKLEKVVGAPDRLTKLADDISEHFTARCEVLAGKGLVVAYSRRVAAELSELLRQRFGTDANRGALADSAATATGTTRSASTLISKAPQWRAPITIPNRVEEIRGIAPLRYR